MERTVIILQSLLVLLVTAHVATGCMCSGVDFKSVLCDSSSTVIRARVISAEIRGGGYDNPLLEDDVPSRNFEMKLRATLKNGPTEIFTRATVFHIVSIGEISECGFNLEPGTEYILVGEVNDKGKFITDLCNISRLENVSKSDMDLLEGKGADLSCVEDI